VEIVKTTTKSPKKMPSYFWLESVLAEMAALREEVVVVREPSFELLGRIDAALSADISHQAAIVEAMRPGGIVDVGSYLAFLLAAYPNAGPHDATIFGQLLVDDVMELAPPLAAVEIACRHWRQRVRNFMPDDSRTTQRGKSREGPGR
jgi:hypothetical protein